MGDYTSDQLTDIARASGVQQLSAIYYPIYNYVSELYQNDGGMNGAQQTFLSNSVNEWRTKVAANDDAVRAEISKYGDAIRNAGGALINADIAPGDETRPLTKVVSDIKKQIDAILNGYGTGIMPSFVQANQNVNSDTFYTAPLNFNIPAKIPIMQTQVTRVPLEIDPNTGSTINQPLSVAPSSATATPPSSAANAAANFSSAADASSGGINSYIPTALQGNLGSTGIPIIAVAALGLFFLMKK